MQLGLDRKVPGRRRGRQGVTILMGRRRMYRDKRGDARLCFEQRQSSEIGRSSVDEQTASHVSTVTKRGQGTEDNKWRGRTMLVSSVDNSFE